MSLADSLLGGKENLTVALWLLGHHISQWLWTCYGMENWLKSLCLFEHLLIIGQEVFVPVQYQFEKALVS